MEVIRFHCGCGKQITVDSRFVGQPGRCPACRLAFFVPDPDAHVADARHDRAGVAATGSPSDDGGLADLATAVAQSSRAASPPPYAQTAGLPPQVQSQPPALPPYAGPTGLVASVPPPLQTQPVARQSLACPACGGDDTQKLSVIFQAGTSVPVTKSSQRGLALGPTWQTSMQIFGRGTSTAVQQSELARIAAPPRRPSIFAGAVRKAQWAHACQAWAKSWFCRRCGHVFIVNDRPTVHAGPFGSHQLPRAVGPGDGGVQHWSQTTSQGSTLVTVSGWVATVVLGIIWLSVSGPVGAPVLTMIVSGIVVVGSLAYLTTASARRRVDAVLSNVRPGAKLPSVRLLVIAVLSMVLSVPATIGHARENAEVESLIATAVDEHSRGHFEEAVELLTKASMKHEADGKDRAKRLLATYGKELGAAEEPKVARLIASARNALRSGDEARAVSLLKQATGSFYASNRTEAEELLAHIGPPQQSPSGRAAFQGEVSRDRDVEPAECATLSMRNYERISTGMSVAEVEAILGPGREQASSQAPGLLSRTEVKMKSWQQGLRTISIVFLNGRVQTKVQVGL